MILFSSVYSLKKKKNDFEMYVHTLFCDGGNFSAQALTLVPRIRNMSKFLNIFGIFCISLKHLSKNFKIIRYILTIEDTNSVCEIEYQLITI